jgi:cytochrome c553
MKSGEWMRGGCAFLVAAFVGAGLLCPALAEIPSAEQLERGRLIYETGRLASGEPLGADRGGGVVSTGEAAACIKCHQRSGYGLFEAANLVPPITGPALFENARPRAQTPRRAKAMKHEEFPFLTRPAYNEETLARALREGVSPSGHQFGYLMPRYALDDADMSALIAYLRQLSSRPSPGIDQTSAHFATVIAPNQDSARRQAVIDTLKACFEERHPQGGAGQAWHLHVWDLTGPPESWQAQLAAKYAEQPVFALVSGLGSSEWEPVHQFAESERIPQLFPNLDAAASENEGVYSFYFWKGVILEAHVIARYLADHAGETGLTRIVQLRRAEGAGAKAAEALRSLIKEPVSLEDRVLKQSTPDELRAALSGLTSKDALVIWLDSGELAALGSVPPPGAGQTVFSGWLSGLDSAPIPPGWKRVSLMVYPVDAPHRRHARMQFNLQPWLKAHGISYADEILLGNSLTACNLLTEGVLRLRGEFFRDYLVELTENYPSGMGNAPAPEAFPRFVIGPGQRYSSKGGYIVKFKGEDLGELELVQDWIVPD